MSTVGNSCLAPGDALAPILSTLTALVVAAEAQAPSSPAGTAFRRAIRRKGEDLAQAGGGEALNAALAFVRDRAPDRADEREALLSAAWAGLAGWRL